MRSGFARSALLGLFLGLQSVGLAADRERPLSATTVDGRHFSLADAKGHVVIVNFWATWCAPCRAEMPALDAYYRAHHDAGLDMLAISLDADGARDKVVRVAGLYRFPVALLRETRVQRRDVPTSLPSTRIYARDGTLAYASPARENRPLDAATLERIVGPLLAGR
jgi:thiol-disulfide isomerase/thioredoxin